MSIFAKSHLPLPQKSSCMNIFAQNPAYYHQREKFFLRFLQSIGSKNLAHKNIFPLFLTIGKDGPLCRKSHTSSPPKILPLIPLCRPVATAKMKLRNARPSIRANRKPEIIDSKKNTVKKAWMENFHPCFFLLILLLSLRLAPAEIQSLQTAG